MVWSLWKSTDGWSNSRRCVGELVGVLCSLVGGGDDGDDQQWEGCPWGEGRVPTMTMKYLAQDGKVKILLAV